MTDAVTQPRAFPLYPDRVVDFAGLDFVSAAEVLRTKRWEQSIAFFNRGDAHMIDLDHTDAFTEHYHAMRQRVETQLATHPLLAQPHWSRDERAYWEATLAGAILDEMTQVPLLGVYRTNRQLSPITGEPVLPTSSINALTANHEFDCDKQTTVLALMMQQIENQLLPAEAADATSYHRQGQYFMGGGIIAAEGIEGYTAPHAWLTSSATGNIVDVTRPTTPYQEVATASHDFNRVLAGFPAITWPVTLDHTRHRTEWAEDGEYALYHQKFRPVAEDIAAAQERLAILRTGAVPESRPPNTEDVNLFGRYDGARLQALANKATHDAALVDDYEAAPLPAEEISAAVATAHAAPTPALDALRAAWQQAISQTSPCGTSINPQELQALHDSAAAGEEAVAIFMDKVRTQGNASGGMEALLAINPDQASLRAMRDWLPLGKAQHAPLVNDSCSSFSAPTTPAKPPERDRSPG